MSSYKVMLQNPSTKQVGSLTVKTWSPEDAKAEAKAKLECMGFTEVVSCRVM